ncbi:hypothetical protein ACFPXP_02825 [Marinicrinis lubricantis]|uniref:DUF3139 domain-containing protein n=1 Tax=Marinicrinis lubricantis TaxID=2086470 RepID=A0ABW1IJZ1_9BACL
MKTISQKQKRIILIIAFIFSICVVITVIIGKSILKDKHVDEIEKVIASRGGIVVNVDVVNGMDSPFINEYSKNNNIYKITYRISNNTYIAWYRGSNVINNIHEQNPGRGGGYPEKWIFE